MPLRIKAVLKRKEKKTIDIKIDKLADYATNEDQSQTDDGQQRFLAILGCGLQISAADFTLLLNGMREHFEKLY